MEFNGTFLVTIISFIVFVFIMNKILYEPISKIVGERQNFVEGNLHSAEENNKKAKEIYTEKEEKIAGARNEAREKYAAALSGYKDKKNGIIKDAQEQAGIELQQAYENLNNLSDEAKEGLKGKMTDLANDIVEKIIGYRSEVQGFDNDAVNKVLFQ